ncbi:MAG: MarC family protein [Pseudomonadota bacterium]
MIGPSLAAFAINAFVTLFVTIGPVETAAVYAALTSGVHLPQRGALAWRSVSIAGAMLGAFAVGGGPVLGALHVSSSAFRFAAGVLLFLQAVALVFGGRTGMSSISASEQRDALRPGDIAVFPLAFPLIAGPGSLAAIVVLAGEADGLALAVVFGALIICLMLTFIALRTAEHLGRLLGVTGADVVGRVSGILLAALAAQFIFDGLKGAALFGN